jgi:autotransporter-associated beta strand protein
MIPSDILLRSPIFLLLAAIVQGAEISKLGTGTVLNDGASWNGGAAPGAGDVALWASGSLRSGLTLDSDLAWAGIKVSNPGGGVTIGSGNILSLGASGINASVGNGNALSFSNTLHIASDQTWTIGASTGIGINGSLTGSNRTINVNGSGYMNFYGSASNFSGTINYGAGTRLNLRGSFNGKDVTLNMISAKSVYADSLNGTIVIGDLSTSQTGATLGDSNQNGTVTYEVGAVGNDSTWAGLIRNGNTDQTRVTSVRKTGSGTWTLTGANTYTGSTIVNDGRLMINNTTGSGTGTGQVIVGVGATLGGTGTIGGDVTTYFTGALVPGPGGNTVGTLTVLGNMTLEGDARFVLNRDNPQNASKLVCAGAIQISGNLIVENIGPSPQPGDMFTLITAGSFSGGFESMTLPELPAGLAWNTQNFASTGTLTVGQIPVITNAPLNQSTGPGGNVSFSVGATGTEPITYQWSVNGNPVDGATGSTFTWENVSAANQHPLVTVVVTNPFGRQSASATLTLQDTANPVIVSEPGNFSGVTGGTAVFEVEAGSFGPVSYQWYRGNVLLEGETGATLVINNAQASDAGNYHVRISNSFGEVSSSTIQLAITPYVPAANTLTLENNRLRLVFDQASGMSRVLDKNTGKNWSQIQWTVPEGSQLVRDQRFEKELGQYWNAGHGGVAVKHQGVPSLRFDSTAVHAASTGGVPHLVRLQLKDLLSLPRTTYHLRYRHHALGLRNTVLRPYFVMRDAEGNLLSTLPAPAVTFGSTVTTSSDWVEQDLWITSHLIPAACTQADIQFEVATTTGAQGFLYLTDVRLIDGNLVGDPGFTKSWSWSGWTGSSYIEDPAVTPYRILKVEPALIVPSDPGYKRQETSINDSAARTYRISFRYKTVGLKNFTLIARHSSVFPNRTLDFGNTASTTGWTEYVYYGTTTAGGRISYYFDFVPKTGAAGELYMTDAEMVAVDPGVVHRPVGLSSQQVAANRIQYSFNTVERTNSSLPPLDCTLELGDAENNTNEIVWKLLGDANDTFNTSYIAPAFFPTEHAQVQWLIPSGEGLLLPGTDVFDPINQQVNPSNGNKLRPWTHMMPMAFHGGITPQGDGYYAVNDTPVNTEVIYKASQVSPQTFAYMPFISHWGSKGKLHHQRSSSIRFVDEGHGYVGMAKDYRNQYAIPRGWHVTYAQKAAYNPKITQYVGTPRLGGLSTGIEAQMIADLSAAGIKRATLTTTNPANAQAAQAAGWMTTRYDNYWDSIHPIFEQNGWLKEDANGKVTDTGWGTPENPLYISSPAYIEQVARQDIPVWNQNLNHQTWFIDVFGTVAPYADYKPGAEYSEIDTLNARVRIAKYLTEELGMVFWIEGAAEYLVPYACYGEGTMTSYGIPGAAHKYRVPLWSLVYHDCWENSWHTYGGNINTAYGWKINDLYNMLYGSKQLLGFTDFSSSSSYYYIPGLKEKAVQSIKKVTKVTRQVGTQVMEEHKFLSADGNVQMTRYADGTKVYVNFGDSPFSSAEVSIPPLGHVMVAGTFNSDYTFWRDEHFSPADIASGMGDVDAVPANDGLSNFVKYAYGIGNPKSPAKPNWNITTSPTAGLGFSFMRARPELTYVIQTSQDLNTWNDFTVNPGMPGQQVSVTVPVQAGQSVKFARLLVRE